MVATIVLGYHILNVYYPGGYGSKLGTQFWVDGVLITLWLFNIAMV